ncbi:ankyrin repeat domain-containing protein [uncultured Thiocystis sp.]|jgi:ankyrin repeat protein|uniref:ankyrin repeat domain-containing protein n=1 Tax=uncultured Thiocystis sp. TaxID=1202134 RepID=UPI0025F983AD|nr:ankyrin repeat domain-containing protein [uncultured Thiocystis sp.]
MKLAQTITLAITLTGLAACGPSGSNNESASAGEALLEVAEQGDLDALDQLLAKHRQPDVRDSCDWTPLMKAALYGHTPVVARLLDAGASVDAMDKGGYTAMMLAASNNHADTVDLLLQRGAMVDHQESTEGWTALIWAAKQGHAKSVDTLLHHRADVTLKDFDGKTAMDWDSAGGYVEVSRRLQAADHRQ